MKLSGIIRKTRWGIAMTEYLIILGIVAIAAIAIVSVFGSRIKNAFANSASAMAGTSRTSTGVSITSTGTKNMGNFGEGASK